MARPLPPTIRQGPGAPPRVVHAPNYDYTYSSTNTNADVNNPAFVQTLLRAIERNLNRTTTGHERALVIRKVREVDPRLLTSHPMEVLMPVLVDILTQHVRAGLYDPGYGSIQGPTPQMEDVDIREIIKSQIGTTEEQESEYRFRSKKEGFGDGDVSTLMGVSDINKFAKIINPKSRQLHNYIIFDTRYRIPTFGPITEFKWNFIPTPTLDQGSVNIYGVLRDIVALRVYPVRIPYVLGADTEQHIVSLNIKELSPQGFIAHENRRFHFLFDTVVDGTWINCSPFNYNDGYYRTHKPIVRLDNLTVTFGSPLTPVTFDADRDNYTLTYGALSTTVTTASPHNLITGDIVFFGDMTTTAPIADSAVINAINSTNGHFITFMTPTSFVIDVPSLGTAPVPAMFRPTVYYGSKRMYIPIELTYIDPST